LRCVECPAQGARRDISIREPKLAMAKPKGTSAILESLREHETRRRAAVAYRADLVAVRRTTDNLRRSRLLDDYADRSNLPLPALETAFREVPLPRIFSFIDSPNESLEALAMFVRAVRDNPGKIHIDQNQCEQIDLCAASVLNELAHAASRELRVPIQGRYPASAEAREIVEATGLPARVGLTRAKSHFKVFPVIRGGKKKSLHHTGPSLRRAAASLADYLERCFRSVGYQLERTAKDLLGRLLGEVLGNVEDHVDGRDWWVVAYMRRPSSKAYGDCHISIFNFGPTVAETLKSMPASQLRQDIEDLVDLHREKGLFKALGGRWSEDALWTLYALQEGVTRFYGDPDKHHGTGTAEMIEAFQRLGGTIGGEQPRMCLLSGDTHILFDGTHTLWVPPVVCVKLWTFGRGLPEPPGVTG
jgi:hypothetical protein